MKYIIEKIDGNSIVHQVLNESQIDFFTKNMVVFKVFDSLPVGGTPSNVFWSGNQEDGIEIKPDFDLNLAKEQKKAELKLERNAVLSSCMIDMGNSYYISFNPETMVVLSSWVYQSTSGSRTWSAWEKVDEQMLDAGRQSFDRESIKLACEQYIAADEKHYDACNNAINDIEQCISVGEVQEIKLKDYLL
jgi:hypothetical protein